MDVVVEEVAEPRGEARVGRVVVVGAEDGVQLGAWSKWRSIRASASAWTSTSESTKTSTAAAARPAPAFRAAAGPEPAGPSWTISSSGRR